MWRDLAGSWRAFHNVKYVDEKRKAYETSTETKKADSLKLGNGEIRGFEPLTFRRGGRSQDYLSI